MRRRNATRSIHFPRRRIDQPLDHIGRFRPSRAAIGAGRVGVGERAGHRDMDRRRRIDPGQCADITDGGLRPHRGEIGADIDGRLYPQRQEIAVLAQRQFGLGNIVAGVFVAGEGFRAVGRPFDRPPDLGRCPQRQRVFDIGAALHAEAAADIVGMDAELVLRLMEKVLRQILAQSVGPLHPGIDRVAVGHRVVAGVAAARFHRHRGDAVDDDPLFDDMIGFGEAGLGRGCVTGLKQEGLVFRAVFPQRAGFVIGGGGGIGDHGQGRVIDRDHLRRVARLIQGFRHDDRHRVADDPHPVGPHAGMRRAIHRRAVTPGQVRHRTGDTAQSVGFVIGPGQHQQHAGHGARFIAINRQDTRLGVGRAQEHRMALPGQGDIVHVPPAAAQQPGVFGARYRLSDGEACHGLSLCVCSLLGMLSIIATASTGPGKDQPCRTGVSFLRSGRMVR